MPGWELVVTRLGHHRNAGRVRTYGTYQVYIDDLAEPSLQGFTIEAAGPGNNGSAGKNRTRVREGRYHFCRHAGGHYSTDDFNVPYDEKKVLPGILFLVSQGIRTDLVVHPAHPRRVGETADLWLSSIGCINPTSALKAGESANLSDSGDRVVALIRSLQAYAGTIYAATPKMTVLPRASLEVRGEPLNEIA